MRFYASQTEARARTRRLLCLFALTLVALVVAMNAALALVWQLVRLVAQGVITGYPAYFFEVNTALTVGFVLGGWWLETARLQGESDGGARLARRAGAREAWPERFDDERQLCNIVDELAIAATMHSPAVMVLDRVDAINAFAAGWGDGQRTGHSNDAADTVVAVTRGALDQLTRDELQGLVAHELSHIREGDTRLNMHLAGMVLGLELIFHLGRRLCERDDDGQWSFTALPGAAVVACGALGWLAGRALKAAVSRQREYLADARAIQFTRHRDGLGGALRKVAAQSFSAPGGKTESAALHPAVHHMLLVDPRGTPASRWLASHPPLSERIRRIYGRPMPALIRRRDDQRATQPSALH